MSDNFEKLRKYLQNERTLKMSLGQAKGRQKVPLYPNYSLLADISVEPYVVYSVSYLQENPYFVGGFMNKPSKKPSAFVAKVDINKNVEWVKEIGNTPSLEQGDCARYVFGFENGCLALVSGKEGDVNRNSLVRLEAKGGVVFKKQLEETSSPCFLQFDEITQNSLLGFGIPVPNTNNLLSSISVSMTDSVGNTIWKSVINAKGMLVDVIKADNKYLAFVNYQNYLDGSKLITAGNEPESWGHLMAVINSTNGNVEKIIPIKSSSSYSISKVFSISSSEVSLIGQTTPSAIAAESLIRYVVVSSNGDIVYSNL